MRRGFLFTKGVAITNDETPVSPMEGARQDEVEAVSPMGGVRQTDVDGAVSACGNTWRRKKILSACIAKQRT